MPRSEHYARYYIGTDGRITVWRRTLTKEYRSVCITEFSRKFRSCAPSGPGNYPVEQISAVEYRALMDAKGPGAEVGKNESWMENKDLPVGLVLPIPQGWQEIESGTDEHWAELEDA